MTPAKHVLWYTSTCHRGRKTTKDCIQAKHKHINDEDVKRLYLDVRSLLLRTEILDARGPVLETIGVFPDGIRMCVLQMHFPLSEDSFMNIIKKRLNAYDCSCIQTIKVRFKHGHSTTTIAPSYPLSHRCNKTGNNTIGRILCKYWRLHRVNLL